MNDKTDLRAACEAAFEEIDNKWPVATLEEWENEECASIIERHIAPLLRSVRIAAIEECVKSVGSFPLSVDEENRGRLVNRLRALKEQP